MALAVSGAEMPATSWVPERVPVTMISFSKSIEPVDWAKAGALSAATPMAKVLAAVVRAEWMRMTKGFPVLADWRNTCRRAWRESRARRMRSLIAAQRGPLNSRV